MQAQEKQDFKNALKNKMKDRMDTTSLPKFAKTNAKNMIECQICYFTTKDKATFMSHIGTKKHQTAVEQQNRQQAKAKAQAQAGGYERPTTQGPINVKRPAQQELTMTVQDIRDDEETARRLKNLGPAALVAYDEDEDEEEFVGPQPVEQDYTVLQPQPEPTHAFLEPSVDEKRAAIEIENRKAHPDALANTRFGDEMNIERPSVLPEGFVERKQREENQRKAEEQKTLESYKQFMDEIKKTGGEDHEEILKEISKDVEPIREDEKEMLDKVIKGDEQEEEDAQDYISNLRKRLAMKGKGKTDVMNIEKTPVETTVNSTTQNKKMEDEDDDTGFTWKKRGLF